VRQRCTNQFSRHTTLSTLIILLDLLSKSEISFNFAAEEDCHTEGLVRAIILAAIFMNSIKERGLKTDG